MRMPAKTPLASANIDAPAACAVPFRLYCGVLQREREMLASTCLYSGEYMLVLAVCLVVYSVQFVDMPECWSEVKGVSGQHGHVFKIKTLAECQAKCVASECRAIDWIEMKDITHICRILNTTATHVARPSGGRRLTHYQLDRRCIRTSYLYSERTVGHGSVGQQCGWVT